MNRLNRIVWGIALTFALFACRRTSGGESEASRTELPLLNDDTTSFVLAWFDEKGDAHVVEKVADVPFAGRDFVKLIDPNETTVSNEVTVADVRTPRSDRSYPVRRVPRAEFERLLGERRAPAREAVKDGPNQGGQGSQGGGEPAKGAPGSGAPRVIIYGASWCGPCHQAASYLKHRGIPFVEKDIEEDAAAATEMRAKLRAHGLSGGSIPVIDVKGQILVGFDARAIERALGPPT